RDHAALLVHQRMAARTLRHHLQGSRRAEADLGILHEQEAGPHAARRAYADLLQGPRASVRLCLDMTRASLWLPVLAAAVAAIVVASLGATMTDLGPWYQALNKPSWQPPDWLFGPARELIFAPAPAARRVRW